MTGGQISPTSPKGSFGTTAPYGNGDYPFKLAELVAAAGATYAARWTTVQVDELVDSIKTALKIVTGEFANKSRPEFSENIEKLSEDKSGSRTLVNSAYESDL